MSTLQCQAQLEWCHDTLLFGLIILLLVAAYLLYDMLLRKA